MIKLGLTAFLSVFLPFNGFFGFFNGPKKVGSNSQSGVLKRLIVSNGTVNIKLDNTVVGTNKRAGQVDLSFNIEKDAMFNVTTVDDELRGPMPGSMNIEPAQKSSLTGKLGNSYERLSVERPPFTEEHSLYVRDSKSGFKFFFVEGHELSFEPGESRFAASNGRLMITKDFARVLGNDELAGTRAGSISISAKMRAIEVVELSDDADNKTTIPGKNANFDGSRPGPDVVVGDVFGLAQFGSASGGMVGLALGTTSCNYGEEDLNWFRLPSNDHPVIPQNLYRLSASGDRMEQIGQSQVKHAFTALTQNLCQLGCNGTGGQRLGSGCSDPYSAGLNAGPNLGSKAWINPFTGEYPRGDSSDNPNTHSGHAHEGPSHRILTKVDDLNTSMNSGARYFAEGQYVTPHEYQWCQSNPGECNQYNNVSYREYSVSGTSSFSFSSVGSTVREKAAVNGWPGATFVDVEPDPGNDGVATVAYKVTDLGNGQWHYEYAIHNYNLDRAVQSFSVATGSDVTVSDIGFHAPPQHPAWANDGTLNSAGFSETPWASSTSLTGDPAVTWTTETMAQNENANAIRWGTMYNFRFRSTSPPVMKNATVGFFKTGSPMTIQVMGPEGATVAQVSVAGRVLDFDGNGVRGAQISVDDGEGNIFTTYTNAFGYYRVTGIDAGAMYTIQPFHKRYAYSPNTMQIDTSLSGVNFTPNP